MAYFTRSIAEIIISNAGSDDYTTLQGLHDIAERVLFGEEINVIDDDYVDNFITAFTLHYWRDELSWETLPEWQMHLKSAIFSNGEYINSIYAYLDKQILADYKIRKVGSKSNKIDATATIGTSDTTSQNNTSGAKLNQGTQANEHTGSTGRSESGSDTLARGGADTTTHNMSEVHGKTGMDTTVNSGTQTDTKASTDSLTKSGSDSTAHTGNEIDNTTGAEIYDKSGTADRTVEGLVSNTGSEQSDQANGNQRTEGGSYRDTTVYASTEDSHGSTDNNSIAITYDTPMGSLSNMRTPDTSLRGEGVGAAASASSTITPDATGQPTRTAGGRTYQYMSGAVEDDSSSLTSNHSATGGNDYTERTFNQYQVVDAGSVHGLRNTSGVTNEDTETHDVVAEGSNRTTSNSNIKTHNTEDTTTYGSGESSTHGETAQHVDDTSSATSYDTTESHTGVNTDETSYGGTESRDTLRSSTDVFNDTTTRVDDLHEVTSQAQSGNINVSTGTNSTGSSEQTDDLEEEASQFSYEVFMKMKPYMNKIWDIFDPLFQVVMDILD